MHSDISRSKITAQLNNEWLPGAKELLSDHLEQEVAELEQVLQKALKQFENGETASSLWELSEKLRVRTHAKAEEGTDWLDTLLHHTAAIPEQVRLSQTEARFHTLKEDSLPIIVGKLCKRTGRGIQYGGRTLFNLFRKSKKQAPVWHHEVPVKGIIEIHLISLYTWVREWDNRLRKIEAETLIETDAWILHSTGLIDYEAAPSEKGGEVNTPAGPSKEVIPDREDMHVFLREALVQLTACRDSYLKMLDTRMEELGKEMEEALAKTGTLEASALQYHAGEVMLGINRARRLHDMDLRKWGALFEVLSDRVELSRSFERLQEQMEERVQGFSRSLGDFFEKQLVEVLQQLQEKLDKAVGIFERSGNRSMQEMRDLSLEHRDAMKSHIDGRLLNPLQEFIEEATLSTRLDRFTSAVADWTSEQPEKATLLIKQDLGDMLPEYEFEEVEWQLLVQRVCSLYLAKPFLAKEIKAEQFLMERRQEITEISQIIYTNLEIADEVKRSDDEDPLQVAMEGLGRARIKLDELLGKLQEKRDELQARLTENHHSAFTKLTMLLVKQDVNEIRMAGATFMAKETAVDWQSRLTAQWARFTEKTELIARFLWKKIRHAVAWVRKVLGFKEDEPLEGDKTDLATFLSVTDEQIAGLPFIYRRLFDFNKEVDERFYIRKAEQIERFKKGYELWKDHFPSTFAIVGEKGSGKSLFVRRLSEEVFGRESVVHVNFQETLWTSESILHKLGEALSISETGSAEELIAAIKSKEEPMVVFLENVQHSYLRSISGLAAMEELLTIISETNREFVWVVSVTRYGWNFLDKVLHVTNYFSHIAETDKLDAGQIEELILRRHRASGYQLTFLPDESTRKSRNFKKRLDDEEGQQQYLKDRYFEKLAKLCEGNSSIAMIFWIRSIREYDDTHFYIDPFDFKTISRIDELESAELFALAAFVLHDSLKPEHLARILNQPLSESKRMVSVLASRSILLENEHGYVLNHLIYRQVVLVLKEANFIH